VETSGAGRSRAIARWLPAAAVLALVIAAGFWLAPRVDRVQVERWVAGAGAWGPLVLLLVQVLQIVVAPLPGTLVPLLAGFLYGPWIGPLVAGVGAVLGSAGAYAIGRHAGRPLAVRLVGERPIERAHALIGGRRWIALVPLFLVPLSPSDAICLVAGMIRLEWRHFILAVLLGRFPKDAALALAGAGLLRLEFLGG
jgi:uncharacterized membrane protein YdjX (TVP38/TMEM64 family)